MSRFFISSSQFLLLLNSVMLVNCVPLRLPLLTDHPYGLETNQLEVPPSNNSTGSSLQQNHQFRHETGENEYYEDDSTSLAPTNMIPPASSSPFQSSINNLFNTLTSSVRGIIQTGQHGLLRAIGSVDKTVADVQTAAQNSTFALVLEGQKAFARVYDETPQQVNRFIQRIGTIDRDNRLYTQLTGVINQWRDNRKKVYDMLEQNGYDFHNVLQDSFSNANAHLGVQELPRIRLGWY